MAKIYIEPTKAKSTLSQQQTLERTLLTLYQDVGNVRSELNYKISGREAIDARLREAMNQISKETDATKSMRTGLEQIIVRYEQVEAANRDLLVADKTAIQASGSSTSQNSGGWEDFEWENLGKKLLEKILGPFGFVTDFPDLLDGGIDDLLKYVLGGVGGITDVLTAEGGTTAEWMKDLFGLNPMEFTSFGDTFLSKLGKFDTAADTVGTVANWATKLIDSFVKNYDEFGGDWCARFWEETVTEAGIKLVEGAAVSAGVSAAVAGICTAVGVACPPALVVGIAAVGVGMALDWALDGLVSWVTGEDTTWVEWVSDGICDGIDNLREWIGEATSKAGETINKVTDTVIETGKKVVDSVVETGKKVVDSVGDGIKNIADGIGNIFSCRWAGSLFA